MLARSQLVGMISDCESWFDQHKTVCRACRTGVRVSDPCAYYYWYRQMGIVNESKVMFCSEGLKRMSVLTRARRMLEVSDY